MSLLRFLLQLRSAFWKSFKALFVSQMSNKSLVKLLILKRLLLFLTYLVQLLL